MRPVAIARFVTDKLLTTLQMDLWGFLLMQYNAQTGSSATRVLKRVDDQLFRIKKKSSPLIITNRKLDVAIYQFDRSTVHTSMIPSNSNRTTYIRTIVAFVGNHLLAASPRWRPCSPHSPTGLLSHPTDFSGNNSRQQKQRTDNAAVQ